jgi:hypothetical protein
MLESFYRVGKVSERKRVSMPLVKIYVISSTPTCAGIQEQVQYTSMLLYHWLTVGAAELSAVSSVKWEKIV